MDFEEVRHELNRQRSMFPREYEELTKYVLKPGVYVDIGTWMGYSARAIARTALDRNLEISVIAIDPQGLETSGAYRKFVEPLGLATTLPFLLKNLEEWDLLKTVHPYCQRSRDVATHAELCPFSEVQLVVVDGSHRYADAKDDFELWYPFVVPGGYMAFHDYQHIPGPTEVVDNFVRPKMKEVSRCQRLIVFQKN
jgi:predicted O-methyltransferase YrrM